MHGDAARVQRFGHGLVAAEVAAAFQRMQALVAPGRAVFQHVPFVRSGNELHAAVFHGCRLQRQPDAQFVVDKVGRTERLVLVPRRLGAERAGLEQGVLAIQRRLFAQQLPRQVQRALVVSRLEQTGGIMTRIVQAGKLGGLGRVVPAHEVVLRTLVVSRLVGEQVQQGAADIAHLVLRTHVLQGQVTLVPVARCLSFRQQTGLFHNGFSKLW